MAGEFFDVLVHVFYVLGEVMLVRKCISTLLAHKVLSPLMYGSHVLAEVRRLVKHFLACFTRTARDRFSASVSVARHGVGRWEREKEKNTRFLVFLVLFLGGCGGR